MNERMIVFHLHSSKPISEIEEYTITFKNGEKITYKVNENPFVDWSDVDELSFKLTHKENTQNEY